MGSQGSLASRCPSRSASKSQGSPADKCQSRSADRFPGRSAEMCQSRCVTRCPRRHAPHSTSAQSANSQPMASRSKGVATSPPHKTHATCNIYTIYLQGKYSYLCNETPPLAENRIIYKLPHQKCSFQNVSW